MGDTVLKLEFEKVTDQAYIPYHSTTQGLEYQIPEPEYYNSDTRPKRYQRYKNLNVYLQNVLHTWLHRGRAWMGKCCHVLSGILPRWG